jgi:hypothetical protein
MAAIGTDAVAAAAKSSPLQPKYGQTVSQPDIQPGQAPPPAQETAPPRGTNGPLPLPDQLDVPPMPAPAEPRGPGLWEEVLKNPTVKSGINTAIREAVKGIFGTGRGRRK